ncbi:M23 family metallopeptidase [Pararhizobium sp. O133]|uniref:M23 family metallopeptidase n=1 Tax=Pararhizobium sp. O133 TaxID=3449278 RepID=UPI003F684CF5
MQQYADMAAGNAVADPLCGGMTYDGHSGTDLRILSLKDMETGFPVIAVGDGTVLRIRDQETDHLVETEADRASVAGRECGNGLVLQLQDDYEVQYCHLQKDSLAVKPGDTVRAGDRLGEIGASGLAQFPHVHITVTRHGDTLDPLTGRKLSDGCASTFRSGESLFAPEIVAKLDPTKPDILAIGVAGKPVVYEALVREGPPPVVSATDTVFVTWAWFANLKKGSAIRFVLKDLNGDTLIDHTGEPLERNKAAYSAFAGKKRSLPAGQYQVDVSVTLDGTIVRNAVSDISVR